MSSPNPFGLDAMLARANPNTLAGGATIGNPQVAQQQQQGDLQQMLEAYRATQQGGGSPAYQDGSGGLGALAMMAEAYSNKVAGDRAKQAQQLAENSSAVDGAQRLGWGFK